MERRATVIAALTYLVIVLVMWAPHTLFSGLPSETLFPYMSDTTSVLMGFFYVSDPLRIHTNFFYQVAYLLGEAAGVGGSYVPYQLVHAFLWWGRGLLVFLVIRRLLPQQTTIAYVAGALVLVHAADRALQFAGQINQFGFIFWMLLACYASIRAVDAPRAGAAVLWSGSAVLFAHLSLWSYESQLLLMLVWPALLVWLRWGTRRRALTIAACWYGLTAVYIGLSLRTYVAASAGSSYQAGVMRHDWNVGSLASDWWFNIAESVLFWRWKRTAAEAIDFRLAWLATAVFLIGVTVLSRRTAESGHRRERVNVSTLSAVVGFGAAALCLSFPVYLLLDGARSLWRTQLLSGIGAAVTLTGALALVSRTSGRRLERFVFPGLAALVVWLGSAAALELGAFHRGGWERHRAIMMEVLRTVPSVKPRTVVAVMNVPKGADPFGHQMWLDVPMRLIYPKTPVVGLYFLDDGSPSPGNNMILNGDRWFWDGSGFPPDVEVQEASLAQTVVISLDASGKGTVSDTLPQALCRRVTCSPGVYHPEQVIDGPPSDRALRRYRLDVSK